jgi:hypothetical protein
LPFWGLVYTLLAGDARRHEAVTAVAQMKVFMAGNPPVRGVDIKRLIEEGRV